MRAQDILKIDRQISWQFLRVVGGNIDTHSLENTLLTGQVSLCLKCRASQTPN